jgi:hypothetical protein
MIHDGEREILSVRILKKLEKMKKDAKTSFYMGSCLAKLEADLLVLQLE